jgi:N-acetylmuramoyl-L-alanine amidase
MGTEFFNFPEKISNLGKNRGSTDNKRIKMRKLGSLLITTFILVLASFSPLDTPTYKIKRIVIDAGHGGKDPGTHGDISKEKHIALDIAIELGEIINEYLPEVEVILTRQDDNFVELDNRARIANKNGADLFISIHCNAISNKNIHGTETWVMGLHKSETNLEVAKRENSSILLEDNYEERYEGFDPNSPESQILFSLYQSAYIENSLNLAGKIEKQFKHRVGRHSRGVKQAGFIVLYKTAMPSVLVEVGFLSNPKEERDLNDDLQQTYIASGIFRAFRDYKNELEARN